MCGSLEVFIRERCGLPKRITDPNWQNWLVSGDCQIVGVGGYVGHWTILIDRESVVICCSIADVFSTGKTRKTWYGYVFDPNKMDGWMQQMTTMTNRLCAYWFAACFFQSLPTTWLNLSHLPLILEKTSWNPAHHSSLHFVWGDCCHFAFFRGLHGVGLSVRLRRRSRDWGGEKTVAPQYVPVEIWISSGYQLGIVSFNSC